MRAHLLAAAALLTGLGFASPAGAQAPSGECNILENQRLERREDAGVPHIYVTGPFLIRCAGGEELRALQGTVNLWTREIFLSGNVFFQDPTQTLTSQQATYSASIGRLYATGDVVFTNRREGSTLRGPELEYFRAMEGRPDAQVNAGQRPSLVVRPRNRADGEPMNVDADRIAIFGETNLSAYGNVVIRRTDLHATGEEAQYDSRTEGLELRRNARIQSERFNLSGEVVQARFPDGVIEHVRARTDATLVGEELRVEAPDLQLFFQGELLQRAVARASREGEGERTARAVASARTFRLSGDSIDAVTPDQRVEQVVAIGRARGESIDTTRAAAADTTLATDTTAVADAAPGVASDTLVAESPAEGGLIDRDWIVGDTIIGYFEQADTLTTGAPADTGAVLRRIVASGMAQSLYRVQPQEGAPAGQRQGINYLAGDLIELDFEDGELHVAEVTGLRRGVYLDPAPPPTAAPAPTPGPARPGGRR